MNRFSNGTFTAPVVLSLVALVGFTITPAFAEYPDRPIRYIMPHNPGGGTEVGIRTWLPYMEQCLGNGATIVVTAIPGGGGALGFAAIATAEPDGYTLGQLTTPGHVTAGFTNTVPFTMDSFEYIANVYGVSSVLAVHREGRFNSFEDVMAFAKESPTPINVGVGSIGNDDHLAGLQLMELSGLEFNLIPFGDNSQTRNALLGGHVDIAMMSNSEIARFQDDLKPLAIASRERKEAMPDLPTFGELGYDLIAGTTMPVGAPKGIPQEVVEKWRECLAETAAKPEFRADAEQRGMPLMVLDGDGTFEHVKSQQTEYQKLFDEHPWGN